MESYLIVRISPRRWAVATRIWGDTWQLVGSGIGKPETYPSYSAAYRAMRDLERKEVS